jgi:hypothetical protein
MSLTLIRMNTASKKQESGQKKGLRKQGNVKGILIVKCSDNVLTYNQLLLISSQTGEMRAKSKRRRIPMEVVLLLKQKARCRGPSAKIIICLFS